MVSLAIGDDAQQWPAAPFRPAAGGALRGSVNVGEETWRCLAREHKAVDASALRLHSCGAPARNRSFVFPLIPLMRAGGATNA